MKCFLLYLGDDVGVMSPTDAPVLLPAHDPGIIVIFRVKWSIISQYIVFINLFHNFLKISKKVLTTLDILGTIVSVDALKFDAYNLVKTTYICCFSYLDN